MYRGIDAHCRDRFHARLKDGEPLLGAFISVPSAELAEICASSGFDFIVLDCEHGSIGLADVAHMIRAAQAAGISTLVRPCEITKTAISKVLDLGADGIIAPQISTAHQARELVAECKYPPLGKRGVAFYVRAHEFANDVNWDDLKNANTNVVVGAMIETPQGVEHAQDICNVEGIDFVLFGSQDFSAQLGDGADSAPAVVKAQQHIDAAARRAGIRVAAGAADGEMARRRFASGYSVVITGLLSMIRSGTARFVVAARSNESDPQADGITQPPEPRASESAAI
ncbi:HpcH/HpaI aldolase family protein [Variovorax sp. DT-64]|uniref:HpcH/HpaI aldolase family protein n=1 Tax=Variovorax sp. DT-64 TaxID=3396160 RepID=UPI003F19C55B